LPFDSSLIFVLDDAISSDKSHTDDVVRAHLRDPIVLGGKTVAPAGTPVRFAFFARNRRRAATSTLRRDLFRTDAAADGSRLPLRARRRASTFHVSAGHESTVGIEDTSRNLYPIRAALSGFRKGKNFELAPARKFARARRRC